MLPGSKVSDKGIFDLAVPHMLLYLGTSLKNGAQTAKLVKPKVVVSGHIHPAESRKFAEILNIEMPDIQRNARHTKKGN